MRVAELMMWSMALGAIATVGVARVAGLFGQPQMAGARSVAFHATFFGLTFVLSGVYRQLAQPDPWALHAVHVLSGPLCMGLTSYWIRNWLSANQRDRLMAASLRAAAISLPAAAVLTLWLVPLHHQLPVAAGLSLAGASLTFWLSVRAWLMGDRLAAGLATACAMLLAAVGGLYAVAMNAPGLQWPAHFFFALAAALGNGIGGFVLWRRDRKEWKARQLDNRALPFDPLTRMHSGPEFVRKLYQAQLRRKRTRREGAVIAAVVFDIERLAMQVGPAGVSEVYLAMARRIQRQVGVVNPVGRYWERCFVAMVETIHSPAWLRTLGLKVSTSLCRPIEVTDRDGRRVKVRVDIGVGVVRTTGQAEVEEILHEAQRLAELARNMRSRAATLDPPTGASVPVEKANLGPRADLPASLVQTEPAPLREEA